MAEIGPTEAQRIVSHMNADHAESLGHYLEIASVPPSLAYLNPQIVSFRTKGMTIEYGKAGTRQSKEIEFEPKMLAGEARGRLEKMHEEAKRKLGLSDVTLTGLNVSTSAYCSTALLIGFELWLLLLPSSRAGRIFSWHSALFNPLLRAFGVAATRENLGTTVKSWWLVFLLGLHAWEIPTSLWPSLRRYGIKGWGTWRAYEALTFFGGFPIWMSLRKIGREEERKLAEKKASGPKTH
ncbi:hypothetical protein JCM11641_008088 [Rhodosporidiobolus odoratus]